MLMPILATLAQRQQLGAVIDAAERSSGVKAEAIALSQTTARGATKDPSQWSKEKRGVGRIEAADLLANDALPEPFQMDLLERLVEAHGGVVIWLQRGVIERIAAAMADKFHMARATIQRAGHKECA